jgi:hypothetical protein
MCVFSVGIFSKRKSENLDFVELAKRGVLESVKQQERETSLPVSSDGMVDFTSREGWEERPPAGINEEGNQVGASGSGGASGGMMGFLDDLAGSGSASSSSVAAPAASSSAASFWDDVPGNTETVSAPSSSVSSASSGVEHLQTKLEDLEYKMERLMEKISRLEEGFGR